MNMLRKTIFNPVFAVDFLLLLYHIHLFYKKLRTKKNQLPESCP